MTLPVKDFVIERLLEYDPAFDVGGGIATTALMVNPLSIILQPLRDELDDVKANQSILSVLEADDVDAFDTDTVDALASNVFIDRIQGNKSSGTVRVRYFSPTSVDIGTGLASFLDSSGNRFVNTNPISITQSAMSLNVESSLYYVDVPVEAEEEGDNDVEAGGIQTFENEPAGVANVTNVNAFSGGREIETNTELINRIKVAVTVRALVTGRGIITTLTDNFSTIKEINPLGFGDPEMQRDIVYNTHVGGHIDIWVKTPSLAEEDYDVIALTIDTTRRIEGITSLVLLTQDTWYSLYHTSIDTSVNTPVVSSADGTIGQFSSTTDYELDVTNARIKRIAGSAIFHMEGTTGQVTGTKTFTQAATSFTSVRPGMQLTISSPSSVAGVYSVKSSQAALVTIFGEFPTTATGVTWQIDEIVKVTYDYNPLAIDIIESARDGRSAFTITDVPVMRVKSIEILDPTTGDPTGDYLDDTGGYGQGGYGIGQYGVGTQADWRLRVTEPSVRFSIEEDNYIDISTAYLGYSLRVTYDYASEISTYQDYVSDLQNRVVCAKSLVKHFIPMYVNTVTGITYKVSASNLSALSESSVQTAVESLVENTQIGTDFELSDIIDLLYNSGANQVNLDFTLQSEIHNTDGSITFSDSDDQGILSVPDNVSSYSYLPDLDNPISAKIAHFVTGTIVLTRVLT